MNALSHYDIDPNTGPTTALYVSTHGYPESDEYLRRIWRHGFLLALVGYDHFQYRTSHNSSTLWEAGDTTARVYETGYIRVAFAACEYRIEIQAIDGIKYSEWIAERL